MAIIDCPFWLVRRQLLGANGGSHRGATTIRMRPAPCNSNRPLQQRSRSVWAYCSWAWAHVLTDDERESWTTLQEYMTWRDFLGQWRDMWAFECFMGYNARAVLAGWPLNKNGLDVWWGQTLEEVVVELLSATRARVTWTPELDGYNRLALFGSGPLRPGQFKTWTVGEYTEDSTPRGWRWIGSSEPGAAGPLEFDLPWAVASGMKLVVMCGGVDYSGMYAEEWRTAEALAS